MGPFKIPIWDWRDSNAQSLHSKCNAIANYATIPFNYQSISMMYSPASSSFLS